jgi:membrane-associated protein
VRDQPEELRQISAEAYPLYMNSLLHSLHPETLISSFGFIGILAILFIETGLLVGVVLPGDSLLFIAGIGASGATNVALGGVQLPLVGLLIGGPICAIAGSQVGHLLGKKYGRGLFDRPDGRFFNQKKVVATEKWLNKYGTGKAIILARFIPFVRTLINPMCGVVNIPAKTFFFWNALGAIIWVDGVVLIGYFLGESVEGSIDKYLLPIVGLIIFVSVIPVIIEVIKEWRTKKEWS